MISEIREYFDRHVASRLRGSYTRALEEEVARLRAENRALVNSILGVAGIPPMRAAAASRGAFQQTRGEPKSIGEKAGDGTRRSSLKRTGEKAGAINAVLQPHERVAQRPRSSAERHSREARSPEQSAPLRGVRRRSWQQIGRTLEVEDARAARRERESDTDTLPTPRNIVPRVTQA